MIGCDFSSRPTRRKPIVVAVGHVSQARVTLERLVPLEAPEAFAAWLAEPAATSEGWVGGFDFPFGLPRELLAHLGWPLDWRASIDHYAAMTRADIRDLFAAFCDARPAGAKFAHRATDGPAGASPSMKWVNPPVAWMLHAGVPALLAAGVHLPGLHDGDVADRDAQGQPRRIALEAYPGLLARELIGTRSYKSDDAKKHTPERLIARKDILTALEQGRTRLALRLKLTHAQHDALVGDASGDRLDAVLCMVQAAWAWREGPPRYGLPEGMDPLEGWIVTAPWAG